MTNRDTKALKVNSQVSKFLPSMGGIEGGGAGRMYLTSSYHSGKVLSYDPLSRMKSTKPEKSKSSVQQSIVDQLNRGSMYNNHMDIDNIEYPIATARNELNRSFAKEIADFRKHLKALRKWEYTQFGKLIGSPSDQRTIGDGIRFFVMSYNILSQQLLASHGNLYNNCDPRALNHSFRKQLLFSELDDIHPDVLCLQEVEESDFYKVFEPTLFLKGYKGIYKRRTGDKTDGCAIFYKATRFSFVDKLPVEYHQAHIPLLDRDNVALFIKLRSHHYGTGRRQTFVVGTTHILFNPKRQDVKLGQLQLLLAELDRFAFSGLDYKGNPTYLPIILTGDFNADPFSPLIRFVTEGVFRCGALSSAAQKLYRRMTSTNEVLPPHAGISDQSQHYRVVLDRIKQWHSHRRSNMHLDLKGQGNLVNLYTSDTVAPLFLDDHYSQTNYGPRPTTPLSESSRSKLSSGSTTMTFSDDVDLDSIPNDFNNSVATLGHSSSKNDEQPSTSTINNGGKSKSAESFRLIVELNEEEHNKILDEIKSTGTVCTFGSGELTHNLRLSNIYGPRLDREEGSENACTTKQTCWTTVDYIFYSKVWNEQYKKQTEGKLRLIRRLGLLTRNQCKEMGPIPNLANSSDHFSLVSEFVIK